MAEDTEKAVWEDNPQTVFEKYEAGEASAEDYIKSLSLCDVSEFAKQSHNFVKIYTHYQQQLENSDSTPGEIKAAEQYMMVLESIHRDKSAEFKQLQPQTQTVEMNEVPLPTDEIDMSPENVAAMENDGATFSALQQAGQRIMDNVDLNAGETIDLNGDTKTPNSDTFSGLQTAADKIKENLQSGGITVDLDDDTKTPNSDTFSGLQTAADKIKENLQSEGVTVDLDDEITITLNPPANAAVARAKMDKAMNDAEQAFAGIKGVKLERGTVDISNGEFKFTPREAPAAAPTTAEKAMDKAMSDAEQAFAGIKGVKIERGTVDISNGEFKSTPREAPTAPTPANNVVAEPEVKAAPAAEHEAPATPTVESHEAEAVSPDIAKMAKKIKYMNTVNNAEEGSSKYVDPQETAQKMYNLYGENASTLLNEALMAPNDVNDHANGSITSRKQTYSREAVEYLANLSPEQAKEYASKALSPEELASEKSPQEKLQDGLADMKANNPEQYGDFTSAISQLANGGNLEDALMQLVLQMMKQSGYTDSQEGLQAFTQDAQTAIQQIEHSEKMERLKAGVEIPTVEGVALTKENADPLKIKPIELDNYGYLKGSAEAQKHDEDMKTYHELYKNDPKKFKKAKEGYEKAVKSGETTGQAKYNLDVINTVEKEEKLKEQMIKDQEKAAKQIKKLEKKIEKAKSKGNDEKAKALQEELDKLMKEQGLKKEDEGKDGKAGKEAKEGKEGKTGKEAKEGKEGKEAKEGKDGKAGKEGKTATGQTKDTPSAETEYAEATQNGFKITKGNEVRTVTFENGGRVMHFTVNDQPMTQDQANQFMKDLQQAPNLDQDKVSLTVLQKDINERSGTIAYAPPKTVKGKGNEQERELGTQDNTLSLNTLVAMQKGGNSMG